MGKKDKTNKDVCSSFKIQIYKGTLYVGIGNLCTLSEQLKLDIPKDFLRKCKAITHMENGMEFYILMDSRTINDLEVIVHEAKHFVNYVFSDRGVALDVENDEPECYFLGWTASKIQKAINRYKKQTQ